jgi:hypothetical protein
MRPLPAHHHHQQALQQTLTPTRPLQGLQKQPKRPLPGLQQQPKPPFPGLQQKPKRPCPDSSSNQSVPCPYTISSSSTTPGCRRRYRVGVNVRLFEVAARLRAVVVVAFRKQRLARPVVLRATPSKSRRNGHSRLAYLAVASRARLRPLCPAVSRASLLPPHAAASRACVPPPPPGTAHCRCAPAE